MFRFVFLFLALSFFSFGQKEIDPIQVTLHSIDRFDSIPTESKFVINFTIKNVSNQDISFILDTNGIFPTHTSSLNIKPSYQLYQNGKLLEISSLFTTNKTIIRIDTKEELKIYDSIVKAENRKPEHLYNYFLKKNSESYIKSIKKLKPNETLAVSIPVYWNKKRYFQELDLEYYLNENDTYELKVNVVLWKNEIKSKFLPEQFQLIDNDTSFITGWYSSNKLPINFK